nr:hypothetical protein [Tanacetum cinerariifolium]
MTLQDFVKDANTFDVTYEIQTTTLLPPILDTRKRAYVKTLAGESTSKKKKGMAGSSSGQALAIECALKEEKGMTGSGSGKAPIPVSSC